MEDPADITGIAMETVKTPPLWPAFLLLALGLACFVVVMVVFP